MYDRKPDMTDLEEREVAEAEARGELRGEQGAAARAIESLPHPEAPPFLAERVMARILSEPEPLPWWSPRRLRDLLLAARWRLSPAAALAAAALVAGGAWMAGTRFAEPAAERVAAGLRRQGAEPAPAAVAPANLAVAPLARPARFVLHAPGAKEVRLAGEFTGWQPVVALVDRGGGLWEATVLLPPGRHAYMFVVDGEWTTDPLAPAFRDDGFGSKNAVMEL